MSSDIALRVKSHSSMSMRNRFLLLRSLDLGLPLSAVLCPCKVVLPVTVPGEARLVQGCDVGGGQPVLVGVLLHYRRAFGWLVDHRLGL